MRAHWNYLKYVLRHKYFVFLECVRLGIPWLGIIHDLSKFLPDEFIAYAQHFAKLPTSLAKSGCNHFLSEEDVAFNLARVAHWHRNRHHWQWWALGSLPMPDHYRQEMLADWRGAGRAQRNLGAREWYQEYKDRIVLHPDTRQWVESQL